MAAQAPPPSLPSAPPVPQGLDPALSAYLMQFAHWSNRGFASKVSGTTAQTGIMLQANDTPPGQTPAVFMLGVKTDGTVVATPMALGTGQP